MGAVGNHPSSLTAGAGRKRGKGAAELAGLHGGARSHPHTWPGSRALTLPLASRLSGRLLSSQALALAGNQGRAILKWLMNGYSASVLRRSGGCSIPTATEQPGFMATSANDSSCTSWAPRQALSPAVQSVTAAKLVPRGLRRLSVFVDGGTSGGGGGRGADAAGGAAALLSSSRSSTSRISMSPQTPRASLPTQKLHMYGGSLCGCRHCAGSVGGR